MSGSIVPIVNLNGVVSGDTFSIHESEREIIMPLNTQIVRNGKPLKIHWGNFHVAAMALATIIDSGIGPFVSNTVEAIFIENPIDDYPNNPIIIGGRDAFTLADYSVLAMTPLNEGRYVLKNRHHFLDAMDGEDLELIPGDELFAYRG